MCIMLIVASVWFIVRIYLIFSAKTYFMSYLQFILFIMYDLLIMCKYGLFISY